LEKVSQVVYFKKLFPIEKNYGLDVNKKKIEAECRDAEAGMGFYVFE
jgi:hypothetical protein